MSASEKQVTVKTIFRNKQFFSKIVAVVINTSTNNKLIKVNDVVSFVSTKGIELDIDTYIVELDDIMDVIKL